MPHSATIAPQQAHFPAIAAQCKRNQTHEIEAITIGLAQLFASFSESLLLH